MLKNTYVCIPRLAAKNEFNFNPRFVVCKYEPNFKQRNYNNQKSKENVECVASFHATPCAGLCTAGNASEKQNIVS